ncbi:acyl carrier protein [Streptomyces zhaozhouensis]|uniref:Acyl carrier protein n=1 Tax=Streptomyces zhaozhouensis TaxID=1300267 RepID=A0A286DP80_9ACTN|nr:acyl carrier protein [Streptomyces zhaozhouensis]SOD60413.1 acyl carrier protein [Streptomyces zhaozhouensis]
MTTITTQQALVITGISEILQEVAGTPAEDVTPEANFAEDLDIDSLTMVEVVVAAEERFSIAIPDAEVKDLVTVADVVEFVRRVTG